MLLGITIVSHRNKQFKHQAEHLTVLKKIDQAGSYKKLRKCLDGEIEDIQNIF